MIKNKKRKRIRKEVKLFLFNPIIQIMDNDLDDSRIKTIAIEGKRFKRKDVSITDLSYLIGALIDDNDWLHRIWIPSENTVEYFLPDHLKDRV